MGEHYQSSQHFLEELRRAGIIESFSWDKIGELGKGQVLILDNRNYIDEPCEFAGRKSWVLNISEKPILSDGRLELKSEGGADLIITPFGPYVIQKLVQGEVCISQEDCADGHVYRKLPSQKLIISENKF